MVPSAVTSSLPGEPLIEMLGSADAPLRPGGGALPLAAWFDEPPSAVRSTTYNPPSPWPYLIRAAACPFHCSERTCDCVRPSSVAGADSLNGSWACAAAAPVAIRGRECRPAARRAWV